MLDVTGIMKSFPGFQKERCIAVAVTGDQVALAIFVPVADRDCRALASAERQGDDRTVRVHVFRRGEQRISVRADVLIEEDVTVHELPDEQIFVAVRIPVANMGSAEQFNLKSIPGREQVFRGKKERGLCMCMQHQQQQNGDARSDDLHLYVV
jgi:hypothetical protein